MAIASLVITTFAFIIRGQRRQLGTLQDTLQRVMKGTSLP